MSHGAARGEFVNQYFRKGRMILVEGELQTRPYTDKNGSQSTWYEINAERVSFTGEKSGSAVPEESAPTQAPAPQSGAPAGDFSPAASDDNYPF